VKELKPTKYYSGKEIKENYSIFAFGISEKEDSAQKFWIGFQI
jgi:hypothetical protein